MQQVNGYRQVPHYERARCRNPRKTPMRAHFLRRTSHSDWTASCHRQRRTSYLSCFRSRTYCNASPYQEPKRLTLLVSPGAVKGQRAV